MRLYLRRLWRYDDCTLGRLFVGDAWECYTLEDRVRPAGEPKVRGQTAIPAGTYKVAITWSPRFKRDMPLIYVPGWLGVRIHPGNTAGHTDGCVLVGGKIGERKIMDSWIAFEKLFRKLSRTPEEITIEVSE